MGKKGLNNITLPVYKEIMSQLKDKIGNIDVSKVPQIDGVYEISAEDYKKIEGKIFCDIDEVALYYPANTDSNNTWISFSTINNGKIKFLSLEQQEDESYIGSITEYEYPNIINVTGSFSTLTNEILSEVKAGDIISLSGDTAGIVTFDDGGDLTIVKADSDIVTYYYYSNVNDEWTFVQEESLGSGTKLYRHDFFNGNKHFYIINASDDNTNDFLTLCKMTWAGTSGYTRYVSLCVGDSPVISITASGPTNLPSSLTFYTVNTDGTIASNGVSGVVYHNVLPL